MITAADRADHWDPLDLLTVAQVAELVKLHPSTVRRYILAGHISAVRLGDHWRVPRVALEDFIATGCAVTK